MNPNDDAPAADPAAFPHFPPGFWRRIMLIPQPGAIVGGLEDDVHRFIVRLMHDGETITAVDTREQRIPWSTCAGAGPFLVEQLTGETLAAVAGLDSHVHCTHLFDLAVLCAAHAGIDRPVRYDLKVADRIGELTSGTLEQDGVATLSWLMRGTMIEGPAEWAGRDLRKMSAWKADLSPDLALSAMMLRRALMVSGARRQPEKMLDPADFLKMRMGACFRYQGSRAADAVQTQNWRTDFSAGSEGPLQGFDPVALFEKAGAKA